MSRLAANLTYSPWKGFISIPISIITACQLCIDSINIIFPIAKVNHTVTDVLPGLELVYLNRLHTILDKEEIQLVNSYLIKITTLPRTERGIRKG
jgi:hypothetical protein